MSRFNSQIKEWINFRSQYVSDSRYHCDIRHRFYMNTFVLICHGFYSNSSITGRQQILFNGFLTKKLYKHSCGGDFCNIYGGKTIKYHFAVEKKSNKD